MAPTHRCVRVAMLNADTSTPNTYASMGTFGDILCRVLAEAALRCDEKLNITHSVYDVVKGEYPESVLDFDAVMITASAASSYHIKPWIRTLEAYISRLYRDHSEVKIFGSCFGHHIICQALLKDYGIRVEKDPRGWEIGVNQVTLTDDFRKALAASFNSTSGTAHYAGRLPSPDDDDNHGIGARFPNDFTGIDVPKTVRLQFVHEDQVIMPSENTSLPITWLLLGYTEHCAVQGVYRPGRVLTLQGHFEFDKFESRQTERIFGADSASEAEAESHFRSGGKRAEEMDDGYLVAEMVVRFLFEPSAKGSMERCEEEDVLPTPRASVEIF